MARTTTNYGFNISEGSDLVNPLTDIFPNFESLDTDLKEVSNASIGEATELKTGTVHALTRTDSDKDVFKFTATSNFTAGDTFTVDSEQVSALTTSGEQLTTGCYIIGSEVLVAKKGTLLTFYISNVITDASTLEGHSASYFATASDLADTDNDVLALSNKVGSAILTTDAQDCSGAINELAGLIKVFDFTAGGFQEVVLRDYPSGYNYNNCIAIGYTVIPTSPANPPHYTNTVNMGVILQPSGVQFYASTSDLSNATVKVALMKIS